MNLHHCHSWIQTHHGLLGWVFLSAFGLAVVADLILVFTNRESISARVWDACAAHPTLTAAGMALGVAVAYLLAPLTLPVLLVLLWGIIVGHLFVHY